MPSENLAEESLAKNPNLDLAQWKYQLTTEQLANDAATKENLFKAIKDNNMAPFYKEVAAELKWPLDEALIAEMDVKNAAKLKDLQEKVEDAEKNQGETEVRDALLAIAEHYSIIGDKENALKALTKTMEKTTTLGNKLDVVFHEIRIGLFYMDHDFLGKKLAEAHKLIEEGGDWDRRNRLRVYQGIYSMAVRDFKKAASLFLDTVSTFTCYELTDYKTFVTYTVICCVIALPRVELRDKVIKGSEIQEILHSSQDIKEYLFSLYNCAYDKFFQKLAWMESQLQLDRYLAPHYRYYVREMRIAAYAQLLESYRSLTLSYMAEAFGVSIEFIDQELARFIAAGRLHAKIDKVNGVVETNRPDSKNYQYQGCIKQGDILLNRIQKLSRVINI